MFSKYTHFVTRFLTVVLVAVVVACGGFFSSVTFAETGGDIKDLTPQDLVDNEAEILDWINLYGGDAYVSGDWVVVNSEIANILGVHDVEGPDESDKNTSVGAYKSNSQSIQFGEKIQGFLDLSKLGSSGVDGKIGPLTLAAIEFFLNNVPAASPAAASTAAKPKPVSAAPGSADVPKKSSVTPVNDLLGNGFETITRYTGRASNASLGARGGQYVAGGIGQINALLYNAADYFKYIAGSLAVLWLVISGLRLVIARADDDIKHARKGISWSLISLAIIFSVQVFVISFFENGQSRDAGTPAQSIVQVTTNPAEVAAIAQSGKGYVIEANGQKIAMSLSYDSKRDLLRSIANYFLVDVRNFFEWLKVIGGAIAIFMIFVSGVMMVNAGGNEEGIEKGKKYLIHTLTAFTVLLMLDFLIFKGIYPANEIATTTSDGRAVTLVANEPECLDYITHQSDDGTLFGAVGQTYTISTANGTITCHTAASIAQTVNETYIIRAIRFFETLAGSIAVFFLVLGGVKLVSSFGNEEALTKQKKQIGYSFAGLVVVLLTENIVQHFMFVTDYSTGTVGVNVRQGIIDIAGITNFILTFVASFSFISIIVAGIFWVANFGNDEISGKSKKAILYAVAGLILSISAYSLVQTFVTGKSISAGDNVNIHAEVRN